MTSSVSRPPAAWRPRVGQVAIFLLAALLGWPSLASAATLEVGPNRPLKAPSAAAAAAHNGDTIEIEPGEYFDCAVWSASGLTIIGKGPGVVITDKTCEGKALFVTRGNDITVRNITFTRARVPDGNGAGIRAEGRNLTIEKSRFINNEDGILAGNNPQSAITITNSEFLRNGKCTSDCAHGVYVGHIALLRIEGSKFEETRDGHHVKSRALRTELVGNEIADGPNGTSSYLVDIPNGGSLVMESNILEKGPNCSNHTAAVMIGEEGIDQKTAQLIFEKNKFTNDFPGDTIFVKNMTATEAELRGNVFKGKVKPLSGDGKVM